MAREHAKQNLDYVGVRLGIELRARAVEAAQMLNIPLSEWLRMAVTSALEYGPGFNGPIDMHSAGYLHGRALGLQLAQARVLGLVQEAIDSTPMTYEEAQERFPNGEGLGLGTRGISTGQLY